MFWGGEVYERRGESARSVYLRVGGNIRVASRFPILDATAAGPCLAYDTTRGVQFTYDATGGVQVIPSSPPPDEGFIDRTHLSLRLNLTCNSGTFWLIQSEGRIPSNSGRHG
eukprot:4948042-Pyramimonas_sp.AAC.2